MSRTGFPARFSTSLFSAALALLLAEGIAVPVIAASPSIESPTDSNSVTGDWYDPKWKDPSRLHRFQGLCDRRFFRQAGRHAV